MDIQYLLFLQEIRLNCPSFISQFFATYSSLIIGPLLVLIGVIIFWCIDKRGGYIAVSGWIACVAINQVIKNIFCVYRPWILDPRVTVDPLSASEATGYSFPSGHTASSVGMFGGMAIWQKKRKWFVALMIVLIAITAFSRNWLGCHTPQDVLVALLVSTITLFTTNWVLNWVDRKPNNDLIASAVLLIASIALLVFCCLKSYPLDYDSAGKLLVDPEAMKLDCFKSYGALFAVSIAWPIERHFIKFTVEGSTKTRIIRGIVGAVCTGIIYFGASALFGLFLDANWCGFLKYALVVFFGVVVYPIAFMKFEGRWDTRLQN